MQSKAEFGNQSHRLAAPVQFLLGKPIFQCFGNLLIVPLRKREVRIPVNADIGQTDYFRVAAVTVDSVNAALRRMVVPENVTWILSGDLAKAGLKK